MFIKKLLFVLTLGTIVFSQNYHSDQKTTSIHTPFRWIWADSAARVAQATVKRDTTKLGYQVDNYSVWYLEDTLPTWRRAGAYKSDEHVQFATTRADSFTTSGTDYFSYVLDTFELFIISTPDTIDTTTFIVSKIGKTVTMSMSSEQDDLTGINTFLQTSPIPAEYRPDQREYRVDICNVSGTYTPYRLNIGSDVSGVLQWYAIDSAVTAITALQRTGFTWIAKD